MADNSEKTHLFIVEDDPTWAALLAGKYGKRFNVTTATRGEDALAQLDAKPDIIILDYHLEGTLTGLDTLKEIRSRLPGAYVVMFSAQEDVQVALDIMENGAYDYVVKKEGAHERLNIILRNIMQARKLSAQVLELRIRIHRWKLALAAVVVAIVVISLVVYLQVCPYQRIIKWDPFDRASAGDCRIDSPRSN
jgi:DNA-binding NtrC family response regulator